MYNKGLETTEPWQIGDICGCGIDFLRSNIFFTKNGLFIGNHVYIPHASIILTSFYLFFSFLLSSLSGSYRFPFVTQALYATVGSKMKDETVAINFGNALFLFDLVNYQAHLRRASPTPHNLLVVPYSNIGILVHIPFLFILVPILIFCWQRLCSKSQTCL